MPLTELEELQAELKRPLPGGRGFQAARDQRIARLHEKVIGQLVETVMDTYSHRDLASLYLEECFGDEFGRPRLVLTDEFQEMWKDLHPQDEGDVLVNEAPDARAEGDSFKPRTELYGLPIKVIDANEDSDVGKVGTLKEITGPHTYLIEMGGVVQQWEVDSVNDLQVDPNGSSFRLTLWNAWR